MAPKKMRGGGMVKKMRGGGMVKKMAKGGSVSDKAKKQMKEETNREAIVAEGKRKEQQLKNRKQGLEEKKRKDELADKVYKDAYKKYQEEEIKKKYSIHNGYRYTGQKICFCEIQEDTILLIAEHMTSARGKTRHSVGIDTITGVEKFVYSDALPIGKQRKYYAAENKISSKNWETQRKYDDDDAFIFTRMQA